MKALEWNDLRLILAIARSGSLAGAARELSHDHSTVFRKLNAIERRTDVRFFNRVNGQYSITQAGQVAQDLAMRMEAEIHELERELVGQDQRLEGPIRLSAPEGPALRCLAPIIAGFRNLHPAVTIEVNSEFASADLSRREADVVLRVTKSPPDAALGRCVCDFAFAAYATRDYLNKAGPKALTEHEWVMFNPAAHMMVPAIFPDAETLAARTVCETDSVIGAVELARQGLGALAISTFLVDADPDFVRIAGPFPELTLELWVLAHADLKHTARISAFMDYLTRQLRRDRALFEGIAPVP